MKSIAFMTFVLLGLVALTYGVPTLDMESDDIHDRGMQNGFGVAQITVENENDDVEDRLIIQYLHVYKVRALRNIVPSTGFPKSEWER